MVTYIFQIFCQKSLLRTLAHLIPRLSCQKPLIENMFFKTTKKIIYSQFLLLSGNSLVTPVCFGLKFCSVIKTWNEKSLMNSQKDKMIFTNFKLFSLFEDMALAFAIMKYFLTLLTFIIPVVYHQNLKLIKICLIYLKLTTLFSIIALCRVIWLHYIFNFYYFRGFLMKIWHNNISSSIYHQY